MSKNLRYSLSLSRLPSDCSALVKTILTNENCNNERSFLNSLLAYGFVNRKARSCNFFTTSFIGNTSDEKLHQFSMPISEENKIFIEHILGFKQGKLRTTEYNYLLFCGFNAFIETCKRYFFSEKYQLINLQNEIKNEVYSSGLYPFFLIYSNQVDTKESEEKYFFDIYKTSINEMFSTTFQSFNDFVRHTCKSSDQSDAIAKKEKLPVPVIEVDTIQRAVNEKVDHSVKAASITLDDVALTQTSAPVASTTHTVESKVKTKPKIDEKDKVAVGQSSNPLWNGFKIN